MTQVGASPGGHGWGAWLCSDIEKALRGLVAAFMGAASHWCSIQYCENDDLSRVSGIHLEGHTQYMGVSSHIGSLYTDLA